MKKLPFASSSRLSSSSAMDALSELSDLICQNPRALSSKLSWILSRCPSPSTSRLTRSHLNAILALASILSKCPTPSPSDPRPKETLIEFLRISVPASFDDSFWPPGSSDEFESAFYAELLTRVSAAADVSTDNLGADIAASLGKILLNAVASFTVSARKRAFLIAVTQCGAVPVSETDGDGIVASVLEQLRNEVEGSSFFSPASSPLSSSASTPSKREEMSADEGVVRVSRMNGGSMVGRSSLDHLALPFGVAADGTTIRNQMIAFEEESIEGLEKQEMSFRLFCQILDRVPLKITHIEQVRTIAAKQLKSLPDFLRIRKQDWSKQGGFLKLKINKKLSVCQAAAMVQVKSLLSLDSEATASKMLPRRTLASLLNAADACVVSSWRKLKSCEELFSTLLSGVAQIAVARGGQVLKVLLLRLKSLVHTTCAQADALGSNQGSMFESVTKTSCEIIEFGWNNDKAPVESFILALASNIREKNDYEAQENEKQPISILQLNVILFLANLCLVVNKGEVVDMILPLFIESLQEGDASVPSQLRLRLLDAVSRIASLGFEKSYRETVVFMTRSYLDKLSSSSSGSAEKTSTQEAVTERVEDF